jgi:hypothetical protein
LADSFVYLTGVVDACSQVVGATRKRGQSAADAAARREKTDQMRKTRAARPVAPGRRIRGLVSVGTPSSSAIVSNGRISQWIPAGGSFGFLAELEARLWPECEEADQPCRQPSALR